jgi:hypothetical protein
MAQIYLPGHPRERDHLQSSASAPNVALAPSYEKRGIFRLEEQETQEEA